MGADTILPCCGPPSRLCRDSCYETCSCAKNASLPLSQGPRPGQLLPPPARGLRLSDLQRQVPGQEGGGTQHSCPLGHQYVRQWGAWLLMDRAFREWHPLCPEQSPLQDWGPGRPPSHHPQGLPDPGDQEATSRPHSVVRSPSLQGPQRWSRSRQDGKDDTALAGGTCHRRQ